jgi:hypothetical protein
MVSKTVTANWRFRDTKTSGIKAKNPKGACKQVKVGDEFGMLTIVKEPWSEPQKSGGTNWFCLADCSCGTKAKRIWVKQLSINKTKSCGCLKMRKHWSIMNGKSGRKEKPNG